MADEHASLYPHFPMSDNGIQRVHQELGRWMHQAFEHEINVASLSAKYEQLSNVSAAFAEQHKPGACQPVVETVAEEVVSDPPTPITRSGVADCPDCEQEGARRGMG